jgi:hypothetical protein
VVDEALAPLQVGVQHDLGVAAGAELVAAAGELGPQLAEVVGLAAVGERDQVAAVLGVRHRLPAALEVDDGQPPVAEPGRPVEVEALVVGAAAGHGGGHVAQGRRGLLVAGQLAPVVDPAGDATHGWTSRSSEPLSG